MSAQRVVVDPVTRIEGHLRIEAMLDDKGVIKDAMSTGTKGGEVAPVGPAGPAGKGGSNG